MRVRVEKKQNGLPVHPVFGYVHVSQAISPHVVLSFALPEYFEMA